MWARDKETSLAKRQPGQPTDGKLPTDCNGAPSHEMSNQLWKISNLSSEFTPDDKSGRCDI
jgi:hypothetical protein